MNCDLCPTPREVLRCRRLTLELAPNEQQSCARFVQEDDHLESELGHAEKAGEDAFDKYAASRAQRIS